MEGAFGRSGQVALAVLVLLGASCKQRERPGPPTTITSAVMQPAWVAPSAAEEVPAYRPAAKASRPLLDPILKFLPADGLRGPASVIHDEASDVYLVSNVDGPPLAADKRGFVSKLAPDGKKILSRWIEGGKKKVVLNAPKGMAIHGDELYVADIDVVRIFNRRTGAPTGEVKIEGATSLSAVTVAPDGRVLVADAGLRANARGDGFEDSGTDSVYAIYRDGAFSHVRLFAKRSLATPTGIFATPKKIWAIASRKGEVFSIGPTGTLDDVHKLPDVALEGIVGTGSDLLVSSSAASAIFRGTPSGDWRIVVGDVKSPAGIGYDVKRKRVLVPLITEDEVRVYDLP